ncbi:uncharacterized protein N7482_003338 [Penicillium canariense]|uniref:Uncharacterized protein n=1 Tax=Penicillium canariense TaxID=189055 RepID=A0A9W9I4B7_9EURO|nr:uncharacterized protein N7482_003338 [Penicillium canariense]KAJ5167744.1 hypothetical protein N7482_003338 [Penicillium canariense]
MSSGKIKVFIKALGFFVLHFGRSPVQRVAACGHSWTWHSTPGAQKVVVLGGSFAGIELTLPTGYKAVWIEKNSNLNYSFNSPRFSVLTGHEQTAFIPYDGVAKGAPPGIFARIQDRAVAITENQVLLASGDHVEYAYLAIETGSFQPLPVQLVSTELNGACHELKGVQQIIMASQKIAIIY